MLGWLLNRRLLVTTHEKVWIERRMCWFAARFGFDRARFASIVLPNDDFYPDEPAGSDAAVEQIFARLCKIMQIDEDRVKLIVCDSTKLQGMPGSYTPGKPAEIRLNSDQLAKPESTTAVLAHELANELLLGGGLLTEDAVDINWTTDLLPAFFGLGVFAANVTFQSQTIDRGTFSWWIASRQGYLPSRMISHAIALVIHLQQDTRPACRSYLRLDALESLDNSLRYLRKTDDTLFTADNPLVTGQPLSASLLQTWLTSRSPTFRLAALIEIEEKRLSDSALAENIAPLLNDRDDDVSAQAARTLAVLGAAAHDAISQLVRALGDTRKWTRVSAAYALGALKQQPQQVLPELAAQLEASDLEVMLAAAEAIYSIGLPCEMAELPLLRALRRTLADCRFDEVMLFGQALAVASVDANAAVKSFFAGNSELMSRALAAASEQRSPELTAARHALRNA